MNRDRYDLPLTTVSDRAAALYREMLLGAGQSHSGLPLDGRGRDLDVLAFAPGYCSSQLRLPSPAVPTTMRQGSRSASVTRSNMARIGGS